MFNSLSGILSAKLADAIHLDTGGVEWIVSVPSISIDRFGRLGERARVLTWLQHREDQMSLYGFPDERSRRTFLELIKVDGIGPRQAMKILSGISVEDLERSLEAEDLAGIERAPGVGHKTAQKILLALKGKLAAGIDEGSGKPQLGEIARALADMGYEAKRAQEAVSKAEAELAAEGKKLPEAEREKEVFKRALLSLGSDR
jgi:Holliday junction DNA helicase RuvA